MFPLGAWQIIKYTDLMSLSHKTQDKRQHKQCTHISSTIFNTILTDKI